MNGEIGVFIIDFELKVERDGGLDELCGRERIC